MGIVTFILGLAGSGKSWLVDRLTVDKAFEEQFAADGEHEQHHADLLARLNRGEHCVVSELKFLNAKERDAYVAKLKRDLPEGVHINWLCQLPTQTVARGQTRPAIPLERGMSGSTKGLRARTRFQMAQ